MKTAKIFSALLLVILVIPMLFSCGSAEEESEDTLIEGETIEDPVVTEGEADEMFEKNEDGRIIVCLDAGHGFDDVGSEFTLSSQYTYEYELTMEMVNELKDILIERGVSVFLTHDGERFPSDSYLLSEADRLGIEYDAEDFEENNNYTKNERALYTEVLNKTVGIDLFVSLHINRVEVRPEDVSGTTIDYYKDGGNEEFLAAFCDAFGEKIATLSDSYTVYPDAYDDAYAVTKKTTAPAVLIEVGYATNESDMAKLEDAEWKTDFLTALADTILENVR